jgi:hypothetical protein
MFILLVNWPPAPLPGKHMKQKNTIPQHSSTQHNREHHHVRQYHPPMPPTKAMGAITQNAAATLPQHHDRRRGTRVWSDLDGRGSGGTIYWGAYSRRNSAGGGVWYPGRIAMGGPNWTVYPGPKNQPYNHTTINHRGPLLIALKAQ